MVAFSSGAVLTASALNSAFNALAVNTQTGTTYTLVLTDQGGLVTLSNASAVTVTIPTNASVAYATGTVINLLNLGAGTVTISAAGGVTLNGTNISLSQNGTAALVKVGTNTWNVTGGGGVPKALVSGTTGSPTIDTTTIPGKTIYKYTGTGSITIGGTGGFAKVLVVAGGGSGGGNGGSTGSGGAGGMLEDSYAWLPAGTLTVAVGGGGAGNAGGAYDYGTAGNDSYINTGGGELTAMGGGGNSAYHQQSTGGSSSANGSTRYVFGQGSAGSGTSGGGAGGAGTGRASTITGVSVTYSKGGVQSAGAGAANTGNGGGGPGSAGGSGIVVVVI